MRKRTTTGQLNSAITNNLLHIVKAEVYYKSSRKTETISADKFKENFEYLCESGAFMDCIGWNYEKNPDTDGYIIETGRTNAASDNIISVVVGVCDGVAEEEIENVLMIEGE